MTTTEQKIADIRQALDGMAIGSCGVKWDLLIWRTSTTGWIVGEHGVRKDGDIHTLESAVDWVAWKRGLVVVAG